MVFMPSNKRAVDLVQCVHHCSGIVTAAGSALDLVIMSELIWFGLLLWYLKKKSLGTLNPLQRIPFIRGNGNTEWVNCLIEHNTAQSMSSRAGQQTTAALDPSSTALTPQCCDSCEKLADG